MSYNTLATQVTDQALIRRVTAAAQQEARSGTTAGTEVAASIRSSSTAGAEFFIWAVADATEPEYSSALAAGNPNPGGDEAVISDGMILSAVQANWPPDPPAP